MKNSSTPPMKPFYLIFSVYISKQRVTTIVTLLIVQHYPYYFVKYRRSINTFRTPFLIQRIVYAVYIVACYVMITFSSEAWCSEKQARWEIKTRNRRRWSPTVKWRCCHYRQTKCCKLTISCRFVGLLFCWFYDELFRATVKWVPTYLFVPWSISPKLPVFVFCFLVSLCFSGLSLFF